MRFAEILNENTELNALMSKHGWPPQLQKEMYDEWVGRDADEDSFEFVKSLKLQSAQPIAVNTKELLSKQENMDNVSRAPQEVIDAVNKKWGTNISIGPQYDPTPERYFKYAKMPAATAKPSIMIDGEIAMGVGRFVAALLRGDKQIKVWDLRSVVNESKLTEGISPIVYHSVNGITSLLSILEQDRFKLTASPGTDTERALQKGDRFYYLSTTRHKLGGYHLNPYRTGFMLNLDGAKLAQRYAGKPVDYWGPDWYANKAQGGKGPEEKEAEDRIYSYKPFIPNASKYIRSIHVLLDPEGYESQEEFGIYYRRLAILAKKRGIPLFIYKDKQDWLNQNTKRATPASKIDIIAKAKGKDRDQRQLYNFRRQYLAPWIELYMAPTDAELSKQAKDTRYNYVLYGYSDSAQSLAAEIHNAKSKPADETGLETLLKIFRKEKIQSPQEYIDLLKKKWSPKDESLQEYKEVSNWTDDEEGNIFGYVVDTDEEQLVNYFVLNHGVKESVINAIRKKYSTVAVARNISVDEEHQNKGHGTELMGAFIEEVASEGAEAILCVADTLEDNEFDLVKWYEGWGFETVAQTGSGPMMVMEL